jgi:hypothetical protein
VRGARPGRSARFKGYDNCRHSFTRGTVGHFGAELKRFIISQYVQGLVTVPRLVGLLNDLGIVISKR